MVGMKNNATQEGYRKVELNTPRGEPSHFVDNRVTTTKYTPWNFVAKALYEQFRRVANIYFALVAALSCTPYSPFHPFTTISPLVFVLAVSLLKEGIEDWKRHKSDYEENMRPIKVIDPATGKAVETACKNVHVGDLVVIHKDDFFPSDLLFLSSAHTEENNCYVDTMNLDGEDNLKIRQCVECAAQLTPTRLTTDPRSFDAWSLECEQPNASLYTFQGWLSVPGAPETITIDPNSILLRGSSLRNTEWILGAVLYTGAESKIQKNVSKPPSKRSTVEKRMDWVIAGMFVLLFAMCIIGAVTTAIWTGAFVGDHWYLEPYESGPEFDPDDPLIVGLANFVTSFILYSYLIPISLYITVEVVKVAQCYMFMVQDREMYHEETDTRALPRTSNLNEELGMVKTVLSDKTGTLTRNQMDFFKASIAGIDYGEGETEIEAAARARAPPGAMPPSRPVSPEAAAWRCKGFNFYDARVMDGAWRNEPAAATVAEFFHALAVCHTAIPDGPETNMKYEAESPDEAALVTAARVMGFFCVRRTGTSLTIKKAQAPGMSAIEAPPETIEVLHVIKFDSTRKRMSIIVREPDGRVVLYCKGADNIIFDRLDRAGDTQLRETTRGHLAAYSNAGLRTLCIARRALDPQVYEPFRSTFVAAEKSRDAAERERLAEQAADMVENDLTLLGCTAIEDRLQEGVPSCIDRLRHAGIKVWMLTGDKVETAINIGHACALINDTNMMLTVMKSDLPEVIAKDDAGDLEGANQLLAQKVSEQLEETLPAMEEIVAGGSGKECGIVIDGRALSAAMADDLRPKFQRIGQLCAAVICCRVSPAQKAQVTRMVRGEGGTTLGIGDGANDVGMIQAAHIGVGISGQEGMQAVMSSDYAIAQFRFLERLLLVHGHWNYWRITRMVNFFVYKNVYFGLSIFIFNAYTLFSGQFTYNDMYMGLYNVIFTSLAPLAIGALDQDIRAETLLKYPKVYQEGVLNCGFTWRRISTWFAAALLHTLLTWVAFYVMWLDGAAVDSAGHNGSMFDMGMTMFTGIVVTVHAQLGSTQPNWTWLHHIFYWGSIALWLLYAIVYGALPGEWSTDMYHLFVGIVAGIPQFWLISIFIPLLCVVPTFALYATRYVFNPTDANILQQIDASERFQQSQWCWKSGATAESGAGQVGGVMESQQRTAPVAPGWESMPPGTAPATIELGSARTARGADLAGPPAGMVVYNNALAEGLC